MRGRAWPPKGRTSGLNSQSRSKSRIKGQSRINDFAQSRIKDRATMIINATLQSRIKDFGQSHINGHRCDSYAPLYETFNGTIFHTQCPFTSSYKLNDVGNEHQSQTHIGQMFVPSCQHLSATFPASDKQI